MANPDLHMKPPTEEEVAAELAASRNENKQITAEWRVPVGGKLFTIEFEHGTTSGKRVLWVDGKVIRMVTFFVQRV